MIVIYPKRCLGIGGLPPWKLPGRERREAGSTYPGHHFWELPPKQGHVIWLLAAPPGRTAGWLHRLVYHWLACTLGVPLAGCTAHAYRWLACTAWAYRWLAAPPAHTAGWPHRPRIPLAGCTARAYRWLACTPGIPLAGLHPGRTAGWLHCPHVRLAGRTAHPYRWLAALPTRTAGWLHHLVYHWLACTLGVLPAGLHPGRTAGWLHCPRVPLAGRTAHVYGWLHRLAYRWLACTAQVYHWLAAPPTRTAGWLHPLCVPLAGCTARAYHCHSLPSPACEMRDSARCSNLRPTLQACLELLMSPLPSPNPKLSRLVI
ncbi:hypothetical protein B0H11DRAFT_2261582 [Mycena galericulata]|nr:hypothetical protein B0H11DRAFT_2261582 [Mycena galericulata]